MTTPASAPSARVLAAWQAALAAEQRAAFGYGLLGPWLRGTDQLAAAVSCSDAHDTLVRSTAAALITAGSDPVLPQADYPDLYPVASAKQARALAARLEQDCAVAWRYLYAAVATGTAGASSTALRTSAQKNLTASAVRAAGWRGTTSAFPGL